MNRSVIAAAIALLVLVGAGLWWLLGGASSDNTIVMHGNVDIRQVSLAFDGSGRIEKLAVEEGDVVKAGQVLAVLDTSATALQLEEARASAAAQQQNLRKLENGSRPQEKAQAQARLAAAQADASRARDDYARLRAVSADSGGQAVSATELQAAQTLAQAAEAQVAEASAALDLLREGARSEDVAAGRAQLKAASAQVALLEDRLKKGELRAPSDAVIRSRLLEVGDMASPQQPVYTLALTSPKWIRVYVAEADLGRIAPGQSVSVTSDSAPDVPVPGTIGFISSVAEFTPKSVETEELRTSLVYEVRVRVNDMGGRLRLGQPVTVNIDLAATAPR